MLFLNKFGPSGHSFLTAIRRSLVWFILLLFCMQAASSAPPIRTYRWGSSGYNIPYEFDSFGEIAAARMGSVVATHNAVHAYPKYQSHPGMNCDGNNRITQATGISTGIVCAEKKTSRACTIPGVSGPYYMTYCQPVQAVLSCPPGYAWNAGLSQCVSNGSHDPDKEPDPCGQRAGNPIQIGLGTKYETRIDYAAGGSSPLRFERSYSSKDRGRWSAMGQMWRHTYSRSIVVSSGQGTEMATVRRADGAVYRFVLDNGLWTRDPDINDELTPRLDGEGVRLGWTYRNARNDETEAYDTQGRLLAIAERGGLEQRLDYDGLGRLETVTDAGGRRLVFAYDGSHRIISVTDPAGNVYQYDYDGSSRLTTVTYPDQTPGDATDNPVRRYHYEQASHPVALTGITDELGRRYATFSYDTFGRGVETKHLLADGSAVNRYTLSYPSATTAVVTDPRGVARSHDFQVINRVRKQTSVSQPCATCGAGVAAASTFDANGNTTSRIDYNGNRTDYRFDLARNLEIQRVEGLTAAGALTAVARTTTTAWHARFRLPTRIAEPLRLTTLDYDVAGNLIRRTLQGTTDRTGAFGFSAMPSGGERVWTYSHLYSGTIAGLIVQTTADGPRTDVPDVVTYRWDDAGNLISVSNALGHTTSFSDYDAHGRAGRLTNANGLVVRLQFDVRGRLLERSAGGDIARYEYDAAGQLISLATADGATLRYRYDQAHRLTQIQDALGNTMTYTLDALGNRIREDLFDPANRLAQARAREYDALNRLVMETSGVSSGMQSVRYGYDAQGNLTIATDAIGNVTSYQYDALNRLAAQIDPAAQGSAQGGITRFATDGLDQRIRVTDARGLATGFAADGLGNITREDSPDSGTTSRSFDPAGNVLTQTDARNVVATVAYDALDRVVSAKWTPPAGTGLALVSHAYEYDSGEHAKGRLSHFTDDTGSTRYRYDALGRQVGEVRVIAGRTYETRYGYDASARLMEMIYPSGRGVHFIYDGQGRLTGIDTGMPNGGRQNVVREITYHPSGGVQGFSFGNGAIYRRTFDLQGRAEAYTLGSLSRTVHYDAASRITGYSHNDRAFDQNFEYDALHRLTRWVGSSRSQSYGYDAAHNRISKTIGASTQHYSMAGTSNRLLAVTGADVQSYAYDAAGNVSLVAARSFAYDARGRMIQATHGTRVVDYGINALGQRVWKAPLFGDATAFHYDQAGRLIAESSGDGETRREYIYLDNIPVAVIDSSTPTLLYNLHTDHLNTVRVITDAANEVRWRWDSDPFGVTAPSENPSGVGSFVFNGRFPGQYFDAETGTHYNYFRDYDPQTGRYLQSDPIGLRGGINTYLYAGADPLRQVDPLGLFAPPVTVMNPASAAVTFAYAAAYGIGSAVYAALDDQIQAMLPEPKASSQQDSPQTDTPEKRADRKAYHAICDQEPPAHLNKCDLMRWKITRAKRCIGKRKDYMSKWRDTFQGHYDQIVQRTGELSRLERRFAEECCGQ